MTIRMNRGSDLWLSYVDANQLENAILNLAINARDAMPNGGVLTIETKNVSVTDSEAEGHIDTLPGDYVMLAVGDSGVGMPEDVFARVIEPFFTTKDAGKGIGLGLSMVYGFVKQSGGYMNIESEVGRGTTIRLCLPRAPRTDNIG